MRKTLFAVVLVALMVAALGLAAAAQPLQVVLLINGTLGDKSFFDSANAGIETARRELGIQARVIEMGDDPSRWEPTLADIAEGRWDVIIVGTWQMTEHLEKIAPEHPNKKFIIFDTEVNYSLGGLGNVYSILYSQNEGSFLAGALAAMVTGSDLPLANRARRTIGFLGGMDIPVINDFLVGYIQGARYVDPDVRVAISYVGDFANPAKGKEMSLAQYQQGADIVFNVAGMTGLGLLDAAKEMNRYALGVDSDQAVLFQDTDPQKANLIVTSMLKRVDNSLLRALRLFQEGKLQFGVAETLGLKEEAVGLADNEIYRRAIPAAMRARIEELAARIASGEIQVDTAFGMDSRQLDEIRNAVRP